VISVFKALQNINLLHMIIRITISYFRIQTRPP